MENKREETFWHWTHLLFLLVAGGGTETVKNPIKDFHPFLFLWRKSDDVPWAQSVVLIKEKNPLLPQMTLNGETFFLYQKNMPD